MATVATPGVFSSSGCKSIYVGQRNLFKWNIFCKFGIVTTRHVKISVKWQVKKKIQCKKHILQIIKHFKNISILKSKKHFIFSVSANTRNNWQTE